MIIVPCDSETEKFAPAYGAPKLVCLQWQCPTRGPQILTRKSGALDVVEQLLTDPEVRLVLHNGAYDLAVWAAEGLLEQVWAALRSGRVHCTWVFERLGEVAGYSSRKKLDLATCMKAHGLPAPSLKDAGLATEFGQFIDADEIPNPHRTYALEDLLVGKLYERQLRRFERVPLDALARLTMRQFALQLMSVWGMTTNGDAVTALERDARQALAEITPLAQEWGFVRADGTRCMAAIKAEVERSYGASCPRTPTGQAQTGEQVLEAAESPKLQTFAEYATLIKCLNNDVPNLRASGTGWISTRYGMADTLRTTSGGDRKASRTGLMALQNMKQFGGLRECIRPRPGFSFYNVDASGLELCSLAQLCVSRLGRRGMAAAIAAAGTPGVIHTRVGAQMAHQSEADFAARLKAKDPTAVLIRTRAKNGVFGYMGGLGAATYVDYIAKASKGKVRITLEEAKQIKLDLFAAVPDIEAWLRDACESADGGDTYDCEIGYGITRAGIWYAASRNNPFQSLAAECMGEVVVDLSEACYTGVLSGARPCLFVHDELLFEVPEGSEHDFEQSFLRLAGDATRRIMPDVPVMWEGEACDRYSKSAKRVTAPDGRLMVWTPEKQGKTQ
jgi:hypothetical protein